MNLLSLIRFSSFSKMERQGSGRNPSKLMCQRGPRLPVSLLEDGPARQQPIYAQTLTRTALHLLDLPPENAIGQLADLFEHQLLSIYQEEISKQLERPSANSRLSAWRLVINLIARGEKWAEIIADKNWPADLLERSQIIRDVIYDVRTEWLDHKLSEILFNIDMDVIRNLTYGIGKGAKLLDERVLNVCNFLGGRVLHTSIKTPWKGRELFFVPITSRIEKAFSIFAGLKDVHPAYQPYVATAYFLKNPSPLTLADALRMIANNFSEQLHAPFPWPLAACLGASNSPADIEVFATRVAQGEMGNLKDWQAAEKRWIARGVTLEDLSHMTDDNWPIGTAIAHFGFPVSASGLFSSEGTGEPISVLSSMWGQLQYAKARSYLSLHFMMYASMGYWKISAQYINLIEEAIETLPKSLYYFDLEVLSEIVTMVDVGHVLISTLDRIGQKIEFLYCRQRDSTSNVAQRTFEKLLSFYEKDSDRKGIAQILAKLVSGVAISLQDDYVFCKSGDPEVIVPDLTMQLAQRNLTAERALSLAGWISSLSLAHTDLVRDALKTFENYQMDNQKAAVFLEELIRSLPRDLWEERRNIGRLMLDIISRRTSGLDKLEVWKALKLPEGLYELLKI